MISENYLWQKIKKSKVFRKILISIMTKKEESFLQRIISLNGVIAAKVVAVIALMDTERKSLKNQLD